LLATPFSLS